MSEIFFIHHLDLTFNLRKKEVTNKNKEVKKYIFQKNEDGIFIDETNKTDNSVNLNESKDHFVRDDQIFWRIWWKQFRNQAAGKNIHKKDKNDLAWNKYTMAVIFFGINQFMLDQLESNRIELEGDRRYEMKKKMTKRTMVLL